MSNLADESEDIEMAFVINLVDGTGREFYINTAREAVAFNDPLKGEPLVLKDYPLIEKHINSLKKKYPATCRLYGVERKEFDARRVQQMQQPES